MRKVAWSILKRVERGLRPRYRVVRRLGCRFLLDNSNWIDTRILIGQPFEQQQIATCIELIEKYRIETFYDVGANIGFYTTVLLNKTALKEAVAFEPVKRNFNQLCGNLFVNQLSDRAVAINKALSSESKEVTIHIDPTSTGVSRIDIEDAGRDAAAFSQQETISCVRLDDLDSVSGKRVLMKIDVEGHELEALEGMRGFLANNRVCLQVEANDDSRAAALRAFFESIGYQYYDHTDCDYRFGNF